MGALRESSVRGRGARSESRARLCTASSELEEASGPRIGTWRRPVWRGSVCLPESERLKLRGRYRCDAGSRASSSCARPSPGSLPLPTPSGRWPPRPLFRPPQPGLHIKCAQRSSTSEHLSELSLGPSCCLRLPLSIQFRRLTDLIRPRLAIALDAARHASFALV